jgi:ATP-dependent 26S proteasome regulatory subunit
MVLSTHYSHTIKPSWRQQCNGIIEFPFPDEAARKQLWRQAIPKEIILDHSLRWIQLARKLPLTGGEISAVAATALSLVQQSGKNTLTLDGLEQALALSHPRLQGRLRKSNRRKPGNSKS